MHIQKSNIYICIMLNISKYNVVFLCFFIIVCLSCSSKENSQLEKTIIKEEKVVKTLFDKKT